MINQHALLPLGALCLGLAPQEEKLVEAVVVVRVAEEVAGAAAQHQVGGAVPGALVSLLHDEACGAPSSQQTPAIHATAALLVVRQAHHVLAYTQHARPTRKPCCCC